MSPQSESSEWQRAWDGVIAAIGSDWESTSRVGADRVEPGAVRRCLEVLEFDCALHSDREVARTHGHPDITVPYTATLAWTLPPMWQPGEILFDNDERDAQPRNSAVKPVYPAVVPPFSGYFATDLEMDFIRPAHAGERLMRRGEKLLSCEPKETKLGRGAFLGFESEIIGDDDAVIARTRWTMYLYNPHSPGAR
jgi:hypothetical protein